MSNFDMPANVYMVNGRQAGGHRPLTPSRTVHSGTVTECVRWVMAKIHDYPETYSMTVPLEAGFIKGELSYQEIEAISKRSDFPK
jgi:hypothetical protein